MKKFNYNITASVDEMHTVNLVIAADNFIEALHQVNKMLKAKPEVTNVVRTPSSTLRLDALMQAAERIREQGQ